MASRFVTTKEKERSHPAAPNSHNHAQDRASSKQTPRPLNNAVPNKVAFNPEQGGNIYEIEKLPVPLADHNRLFSKPELNPAAGQSTHRDVLSRSNPKLPRKTTLSQTESIADTTVMSSDDLHNDRDLYHQLQHIQTTQDDDPDALDKQQRHNLSDDQLDDDDARALNELIPDWEHQAESQRIHMQSAAFFRSPPANHYQMNEILPAQIEQYQHLRKPTTNPPAMLNRLSRHGEMAPPTAKPMRARHNNFDEEEFSMSTRPVAAKNSDTRSRIATTMKTSSNVSSDDNEQIRKSTASNTTPKLSKPDLKRSHYDTNLDYDIPMLKNMSFAALDDEGFTKDPRWAPADQTFNDPGNNVLSTLPDKLSQMPTMSQGDVKTLFLHQTDADREETGQWFMSQLSTFMSELQDIRVQRREVSMKFEDSVKRRLAAVELKGTYVQSEMNQLKSGGQQLIGVRNRAANERAGSIGSATTATTTAGGNPGGDD